MNLSMRMITFSMQMIKYTYTIQNILVCSYSFYNIQFIVSFEGARKHDKRKTRLQLQTNDV